MESNIDIYGYPIHNHESESIVYTCSRCLGIKWGIMPCEDGIFPSEWNATFNRIYCEVWNDLES